MKLKSKKGKLSTGMVNTAILAIVLLVVLFRLYAQLVPEAQSAGDDLNASNYCIDQGCYYNTSGANTCGEVANGSEPCDSGGTLAFGGLFSSDGVVFIVIMAALIIVVVKSFLKGKK